MCWDKKLDKIFNSRLQIKQDDPFRSVIMNSIKNHNKEDLDALISLKKKYKRKSKKRKLATDIEIKLESSLTAIGFILLHSFLSKSIIVFIFLLLNVSSNFASMSVANFLFLYFLLYCFSKI